MLPVTAHGYSGVAVDSSGRLYIADDVDGHVLRLAPGSSTPTVLPLSRLNHSRGVAVDSTGNVYVTEFQQNGRVLKLPVA